MQCARTNDAACCDLAMPTVFIPAQRTQREQFNARQTQLLRSKGSVGQWPHVHTKAWLSQPPRVLAPSKPVMHVTHTTHSLPRRQCVTEVHHVRIPQLVKQGGDAVHTSSQKAAPSLSSRRFNTALLLLRRAREMCTSTAREATCCEQRRCNVCLQRVLSTGGK